MRQIQRNSRAQRGSAKPEVQKMNARNYRDLGKRIAEAAAVVLVLLTISAAESIANFILI